MAWASWWLDDHDGVFTARERAFGLYRDRGEDVGAARAAIWLGCDHYELRHEPAIANGWYQRARRLLRDAPRCVEHGWLAFQEGAYALEVGDDTVTAKARAAEVARTAKQLDHSDLEFLALALEGLALVTEGQIDAGMSRLDEVGVAATAGELRDRVAIAWSLCYLIYACERVRDFERAAQWCKRAEEFASRCMFEFGMGSCRAHYGSVLVLHGHWDAAEAELQAATAALSRSRPHALAESAVRIGELRRRQGRVDEARRLFAESLPHPLAVIGVANLALTDGDVGDALESLGDLLAATPTPSVTQRADALALLARAHAMDGDVESARLAAEELQHIAEAVATRPLLATAAMAAATVAEASADHAGARRHLGVAVDLFDRSGLPYEAEAARRELTRLRGAAPTPPVGPSSPLDRLSAREREVIALLAEGLSDRELAERLHISSHTAHRHVSNILAKLGVPNRAAAAAMAAAAATRLGRGSAPDLPR